jgi:hypothetical protein
MHVRQFFVQEEEAKQLKKENFAKTTSENSFDKQEK